jgi:hypothetical protein
MVEAGCNAYEIAEKLERNPNAVYEKAKRLGLVVIISRKSGKIIITNLKLRLWNRKRMIKWSHCLVHSAVKLMCFIGIF